MTPLTTRQNAAPPIEISPNRNDGWVPFSAAKSSQPATASTAKASA